MGGVKAGFQLIINSLQHVTFTLFYVGYSVHIAVILFSPLKAIYHAHVYFSRLHMSLPYKLN